jgi:gas vesicle protein GvpK
MSANRDPSPYRFAVEMGDPAALTPATGARARIELEPGKMERGLLKLVLSLVELLRQVMEKQAMHRIEAGSLAPDEIDRLGRSLMEMESKIQELQAQFGIDDLNIDLGPVGNLLDE